LTLDRELTSDSNSYLTRSIKANLPSFADQFTVTVPLTRIRDIAHRNDIPSQLKSEIKNRLQNKLHRCADPGDLKTCEELIQRVRPDHSLSQDFKREFEIFYKELQEFFNAQGLDTLLERAMESGDVPRDLIGKFLEEKRNPKDGGEGLLA
jgi:phosphoglucan,water dikinase